ncbi:MAG TPA: Gfo/Idh/MocA family oxidoreductase [Pirellulales bacterium]|nr:Gfo/Idh/MocA family oxidoreductase [Pirellulales bacterium]
MPDTFRVAVIGRTGRGDYGHAIDTVWAEVPATKVVAVADDDRMGLAAAAKRLGVDRTYADYRQMLDEVKPDIVAIAPRWVDQHRDMTVAAAERGIHIFMEKPFCRSPAESDEIIAACERTHTRLAIAHQTRYSPKIDVVRDMIAAGRIGKILELRGRGKEDQRGGGEDLFVLGSHIMNLICTFGGAPQWCFGTVAVDGRPAQPADVKEGPEGLGPLAGNSVSATYGMPDGVTAYFNSVRGGGQSSRFGLLICGSAGLIEIQTGYVPNVKYLDDPNWSPGRSGRAWQDISTAGLGQPEPLADGSALAGNKVAVLDLIDAIRENREPKCSAYDARSTIEMIMAVFASHVEQGPVAMPLANRQNALAAWK